MAQKELDKKDTEAIQRINDAVEKHNARKKLKHIKIPLIWSKPRK